MGAFMNLVYEYANYIILAGMLLQMIIILQVLVKVNRTDRRLQMIQGKVEDYLNVILTEDSGKEEPLVSRQEELMRSLWESEHFIDDNTLTVNVTRLRKKLEEIGLCEFIKTRKGIGYQIREEQGR